MLNAYLRLIRFDKPIGTLLLLWPTWWALWLAWRGLPPFGVWFAFSAGVFLTRSAGCAINDFADSEFDAQVERTANRPLATGVISKTSALVVTLLLSLLAFVLAGWLLQPRTLIWAIPAVFLFVSYPYFKRFFPIPQLYLGIAFSFGIPMAFVEASGAVPLLAWLLFAANVCWVLAYDTIYALVDLPDDLKIGLKTSAITFGRQVLLIINLCYASFFSLLLVVGLLAQLNWCYYLALTIVAIVTVRLAYRIKTQDREACFKVFLANNWVGLMLFVGIALSHRIIN